LGYVEDGSNKVTPVLYHRHDTIVGYPDPEIRSYLFELPEPDDSFNIGFLQEDAVPHTFVVTGFIPEIETPGMIYHAIGVNGASVSSYLESEYFEEELRLLAPDLIIFAIGTNDAVARNFTGQEFCRHYDALIERIERAYPECAYIFITNNDSFRRVSRKTYAPNNNGAIAREFFYELAKTHQGGVWDLFELMGGPGSIRKWQNAGLAQPDKVHFTKNGYLLLGDMFYNALVDYYNQLHCSVSDF
jgi:lysophospholipase L1-like esterase